MRKDIWIRKEDIAKWEQIEDKPLFIHNAINGLTHVEAPRAHETATDESLPIPEPKMVDKYQSGVSCKHGYHPSLCKFSRGGKPCRA